jgi:hypothetical protein
VRRKKRKEKRGKKKVHRKEVNKRSKNIRNPSCVKFASQEDLLDHDALIK